MKKSEVEHIIRACAGTTGETEFIIVGSQAILASHPDAPRILRESIEVDIYPEKRPEKAIEIDGAIGERSNFQTTHGYYAHGVGPDTATLPAGWRERTVDLCSDLTNNAMARCLEIHDLAFSKLVAGREKDFEYVKNLLKFQLINRGKIQRLIAEEVRPDIQTKLQRNWIIATSRLTAEQKQDQPPPEI
jgi:hypothetical protein